MAFPRLSKKSKDFSDSLQNAVTFPPLRGGKVLAALAERLAKQGIQGIRSHSRRAAAPSSSPANTRANSSEQRFFDKLSAVGKPLPYARENFSNPLKIPRFQLQFSEILIN